MLTTPFYVFYFIILHVTVNIVMIRVCKKGEKMYVFTVIRICQS